MLLSHPWFLLCLNTVTGKCCGNLFFLHLDTFFMCCPCLFNLPYILSTLSQLRIGQSIMGESEVGNIDTSLVWGSWQRKSIQNSISTLWTIHGCRYRYSVEWVEDQRLTNLSSSPYFCAGGSPEQSANPSCADHDTRSEISSMTLVLGLSAYVWYTYSTCSFIVNKNQFLRKATTCHLLIFSAQKYNCKQ